MTEAVTKELCNLTGLYFDKSEAIYKEIVQNVKQFDNPRGTSDLNAAYSITLSIPNDQLPLIEANSESLKLSIKQCREAAESLRSLMSEREKLVVDHKLALEDHEQNMTKTREQFREEMETKLNEFNAAYKARLKVLATTSMASTDAIGLQVNQLSSASSTTTAFIQANEHTTKASADDTDQATSGELTSESECSSDESSDSDPEPESQQESEVESESDADSESSED